MIYRTSFGHVRRADLADALSLGPNLRPEDLREVRSAGDHRAPEDVLAFSIATSKAYTAIDHATGEVINIFGVSSVGDGTGSVWMLGSKLLQQRPVSIARHSRQLVGLLHQDHQIIWNVADTRNTAHIAWLRWLGFRFLRTSTTLSADGTPFVEFFRKGEPHV